MKKEMSRTAADNNRGLPANGPAVFPLTKLNFMLMAVAVVMIIAGFMLMLGPGSTETQFNPDIFSTRRIVVGPFVALAGFVFMGFAIMWKSKRHNSDK